MHDYEEKRGFIRMRMGTAVTIEYQDQNVAAECIDLSSTGMQVEVSSSLELIEGERMKVHIPSSHPELADLQADTQVQRLKVLDNGRLAIGLAIISMQ